MTDSPIVASTNRMSPVATDVCAIVVTYGDRYELLHQTVLALLSSAIAHVVVVYNGNWLPKNVIDDPRIENIQMDTNLGSAGGFRAGIETALQLDADYFLLLDDDNLPAPDCLDQLFAAHTRLGGGSLLALQAFRPSQPWQQILVREGVLTIARPNTYGYFNWINERYLLQRQLGAGHSAHDPPQLRVEELIPIDVAAYGGLFMHREALLLGERPDPRYFCYYDDIDFTDRLTHRGVSIHLCTNAVIDDLETSWHASEEIAHAVFSTRTADLRIYLDLRNAFIFNRSRITNRLLYRLNGVGFWLGIVYLALFRSTDIRTTLRRLSLIRRAVRHGTRGEFTPCPT